jgi:hypothetical protein
VHIYERQIPDPRELSIGQIPGGVPGGGGWLLQELTHALHYICTIRITYNIHFTSFEFKFMRHRIYLLFRNNGRIYLLFRNNGIVTAIKYICALAMHGLVQIDVYVQNLI